MPLDNKTQQIYTTLKGGGADVGSEQEFNDYFYAKGEQGYQNRLEVWKVLKGGGADVGNNYEEFAGWLQLKPRGTQKPAANQAAPQQSQPKQSLTYQTAAANEQPKPTQAPQPVDYLHRPGVEVNGKDYWSSELQKQKDEPKPQIDPMSDYKQEIARQQQPVTQTNTPADQYVVRNQGQFENEVRQSAAKNAKDLFGIGVDYEVGRVMNEATKRWEKQFDPRGMVGEGSEMFALTRANKEIDPERMTRDLSAELQKRIGGWLQNEDKVEAIVSEAQKLGVSPDDYANMVVDNIVSQAQKRLEEKVLEGYMPKGTADYILSGLHDSLIGTLFDMGTMTKGQRQMMQRANQQFSEENKKDNYWGGTVTDLVRGGVGFMGDAPVFGALGKVASPMVRGTGALLENMGIRTTMGMSDAAFQRLSQVALNNSSWLQRMGFGAGRAIAGSAYNFGLYEGTSNVVNDLSVGDDTSLGTLAGDFIEGFAKGSAKGAVLGAFSRPFQAVSPRFGVRSDMGIGQKVLVGTGKGALATGNIMAEGLGFTAGSYLVDENARNRVKNSEHPWEVVMQDTMENTMMAGIFKMMNGHNILHPVESLKKAFEPSADSSFNFQNWQKKEIEEAYGGKFISTMEDIARSADAERNTKMSQFYEDFMNRNDISWDTKNKVSAILTGNMAMFPPIPSRISIDNDKKEVVAMGRNGEVLFRREYENPEEAEAIKSQLDMSRDEQMLHNLMGTFLVKDKDGNVNPESQKQLDDTMAQVGYETALNKEGIVNALNKAPGKRSEMEQYAIDELYDRLYNIRFPENQPHPAQDRQNGRDIADKTLDISELDPAKNPNGVEPGKYDQLTQAYDEANKALEAAFKNNDAFYQFVKEQRNNGLSDGEIALEARKMAFSEEESQALIDYERAREQVNGFVELTGERIGEYVSNEVSNMTFKGELDGQPVNDRFIRVVDDDGNQYYLRTGKVTVGEDGRLISTDGSGTVIVRGEDGKDKMVLADTVKMMPEDPANPMRDDIAAYSAMRTEQLQEAISLAIDAEGKLQQTEEPKSHGQLAYEQEQDDVQQNGGLVKNDLADQTLSETLRGSLHSLGRKIGKKIQVVTKDELKQINPSAPDNARGMRSADNKTLYLVSDYVKDSEYMQRFVAGHELTHSIRSESGDEKVWNEFVDSVRSHMGDAAFEQAVKDVEKLYEKSGVHLEREAAIEEVCSDWAGEHLMQDEASIRHIVESVERAGRDSVSFTQRIKQLFEDMIAAITGSGRTLSSEDKAQLEKLIRARDLWEQMYNECVAKNEAKDKAAEEQRIAEQKAADERKAREDKGVVFGEDGEADYTKMTPEATITDLTEQAGPELVETVVNTMLNNAEKALKGVKDVKPASDKPSDVIAAAKETAANKKAAQDAVDYWKEVQEKHKEMVASAEAEAKRQEEEEAKRQAEEAARLQAEAERQERLSTPEGRAAEIAKAKVVDRPKAAKEIYGDDFNDDMTPSGVDEYIMSYFSGKIPDLGKGFIDTDSFEQETGHKVEGFKGDSKAYYNYLAGRGKGKTLAQIAEEIWHSMPESLKETTDDVAIKNKISELLTSAQKATDIRDALLNSRILEAERKLAGEAVKAEEQEAGIHEETVGEEATSGLPFAPSNSDSPFSLEKAVEQNGASYSLVEDPAEIDRLDKEKKIKVYRSIQIDKDGNARSPIASKLGKGSGKVATSGIEEGRWERADEHPELADENGKIVLDKGDGNGTLTVAYNPYIHTSRSMINDQFSSAWKRDNIVVIETEVPESELTAGYHADKAKDAVGEHAWKAGPVGRKLPEDRQRKVILSRWDKPVRTVSWEEVADDYARTLEGLDIEVPFNVVPKQLLPLLVERGIKIGEPEKGNAGDAARPAYEEWKNGKSQMKESVMQGQPMFSLAGKDSAEEIKPVGTGDFGDIYDQFKGKPKEAIDFLLKKKSGEAVGALSHKDVGDIDLVWGEEGEGKSDGFGLAKLAKYHPEVLDNLQEILDSMTVKKRGTNRIRLHSKTHEAAISLNYYGKEKKWLLTAYEKENPSATDKTMNTAGNLDDSRSDTALPRTEGISESKDTKNTYSLQENKEEKTKINTSDPMEAISQAAEDFREKQEKKKSVEELRTMDSEVDTQKDDVLYSVHDILKEEERNKVVRDLMRVTGRSEKTCRGYLKAEESLAKVILDNDNVGFLDLQVDESVPSIWNNSDYPQGTVEFSNICRKRLPFTSIYQRLQKEYPNTVFDASTLETIRRVMKENGEDVACGLCYVEDRRQMLGEIGKGFVDMVKGEDANINDNQRKALDKLRESGDDYVPDLYELLTLDGMKKLRREHPAVAQAFIEYNNARGMQAGRLFQAYSAYHRDILKYPQSKVESINNNGGLRIFSFSDFEAHHLIDLVQVLTDCASKGIKVQGYTKVPEFAKAIKDTGMKLNRSLIPKGEGFVDADYAPKEGEAISPNVVNGKRLLLDTVEGIDVNHPDFFDSTDNKNVGNIVVGINDEHIRTAMQDPFVDYIIPFHSGLSESIRNQKGIGDWVNYKLSQLEKKRTEDGKLVNADKHGINIYTDVLPRGEELIGREIKNARDFQAAFFKACEEKGWVPRFEQFIDRAKNGNYKYTPGYEKLLLDFKLFDSKGRIVPQEPVKPIFDNEFNKKILDDYVKGEKERIPNDDVYNKVKESLGLDEKPQSEPKYSLGEVKETDGENRVMTEEQRKKAQFDIIQKTNPKDKDLNHTWIEKPEDVKTFQESFKDSGYDINEDLTPDFTSDMAKKAIETGKIKVYSSHRIKDGEFVTPSEMEAKNYAGEGKVYSKNVPLEDVAWIDPTQGQYAKVDESKFSLIGSQGAESMDKAEGTTRRIDNRKTAEEMEKAGKSAKEIWYATGWERGKDGKWRYEIPDFKDFAPYGNMEYRKNHPVTMEERERFVELNTKKIDGEEGYGEPITEEELQEWAGLKAKINPIGFTKDTNELKLSDFIDAEDLFNAYPELRDMKVEIEDLDGEFSGMYTPDKTILLDSGLIEKARGNNFDETLFASSELKDTLIHEIQHAIQDIEGFSHGDNPHRLKGGSEIGDDAYNRSAGEVEARNVEKRRLMGAGTRRKKSPESTEDVSREEQHVYEGNLSEDMRAGRPIGDPMEAIERSSKLWKEERRVLGTQPKAHAETSNGGRMAIDAGKEPTIEDEYAHYSLSPSPTNTLLQTDENRRYHEFIGGKAFDWIEAHQNDLQSVIALEKGILKDAAPKDYENVFYAMNHMGGVVMQKENNYVRHYYSRINNAANEAAAKLRGNNKKKKYQEAMDEVEDYVAMKCGLERNRALYVRDNGNDQDKADFANLMDSLYNDLSARRITFADYLGKMDEFIRSRIDAGYKADKHDMSGLSNKNANGYDDAALTQEVMDTEALFGEALTDEVWNSINSATDYILNERYESGLMSKAEKERLERQWHFYVPLQGWAEPTAEEMYDYTDHMMTSVGSPVLKRAGGRTSKADDPLAMIGANASRLIRDAELNRVHQTAVRLARGHAGNGLLEEMNTWYEKTGTDAQGNPIWEEAFPKWSHNATADDITQAIQQFNADMEAKQQNGDARKTRRGLNIRYPMAVPSHVRQHIINAWIGGEKVRLIVQGNPRAAQALNGELRIGTDNKFVQTWDSVNRLMMGLNTSYNPEFIVSNGERDLEMAVNNLIVKEGREYTGRFLKNYFGIGGGNTSGNTGLLKGETLGMGNIGKRIEAFNGIWNRYYNNALDMSKESDRMFKEFMDNGGPTGYVTNQNLDKYKKELYKGVREKDGNVAAKAMTKLLENPFGWALSSIEELNTRVENLTRFAAYQTSRQGGRSVLQSIHDAKEVSVNFGTRGAGGNTKGAAGMTAAWGRHTFYFYNAGVQSLEMYARNIRKHPIKGVATMMLKPFMAGAAVALWNMLNGSDDETGMKSYAQLNPWVRRNNLIIPAGDGAFWTYPLPIEIRAFYGMGEAAAGMFFEETRDPNPALTMAGQITQMTPIDVLSYMSEQPKDITDLALRFGTALLPSVIQSDIIQPAVNMNFYGAPLEKEPNPYDEFEPRWQRTFMRDQNTSIYRGLKWLEQNTRRTPSENSDPESPEMTKQQKGYVDISPAIAKHMVDNIFGGTGAWVMRLGDATRNGWEWLANGGESPIKESRGIPFVRTNYRSAQKDRGEGRQRARMYDLKKMMKNVEDNIKFYGKDMKVNPMHNLRYKELWDSEEGQLYREFYDDIKLIDKYEKKVKAAPEGEAKRNAQERLNEQRRVLLELIDAKQAQLQGDAIE